MNHQTTGRAHAHVLSSWRFVLPPMIATLAIALVCELSRRLAGSCNVFEYDRCDWMAGHQYLYFVPVPFVLLGWALAFSRRPRGDHLITHVATIALALAILIVPIVLVDTAPATGP